MKTILILTLLLVLSLAPDGQPASAQTSTIDVHHPIQGSLAVQINRSDLFVFNPATGNGEVVATVEAARFFPFWSPDGDRLLYWSRDHQIAWYDRDADTTQTYNSVFDATYDIAFPYGWLDDSTLLYIAYRSRHPVSLLALTKVDALTQATDIIRSYERPSVILDVPYPPRNDTFELHDIPQIAVHPTQRDWVAVQYIGQEIADNGNGAWLYDVVVLWNIETGQMYSINELIDPANDIKVGSMAWNEDGTTLALAHRTIRNNYISFINFEPPQQPTLEQTVETTLFVTIEGWLGAGDLLITRQSSLNPKIFNLSEVIDGQLLTTPFIQFDESYSTLFPAWYMREPQERRWELSCLFDHTLPTQLTVGIRGQVTFTDGTPSRLRVEPGTTADVVTQMPEGTRFDIIRQPECRDGFRWWQIELDDGTVGWAAEGSNDEAWLEPISE